ncbi:MAG: phosphate propanoyltransferase [Clostridiales bacterium]|nr:phosphate propanoyltransferase [Candidatus Crickella equi]
MGYTVKVGISNKHLHLSQEHLEILFGKGATLTVKKELGQPGQFAAEECVEIIGPKRSLGSVRVLGPVRKETQVELALTDARGIGIKAPIRESGKLEGTPGCKLVGPCGEIELDHGVIAAMRHIHLSAEQAAEAGVQDKEIVMVKVADTERPLVFDNVLIRSGEGHLAEAHFDTDEGNAAQLANDMMVEIIKK